MNKNLFKTLIILLLASCTKEKHLENSQQLKLDSKKSISMSEALSKMKSSSNNITNQTSLTVNNKSITIDMNSLPSGSFIEKEVYGIKLIRTHGCPTITKYFANTNDQYIKLPNLNAFNKLKGSGFAIQYPFKKGTLYSISFSAAFIPYEVLEDQVNSLKRKPSFQIQLSNDITITSQACENSAPVDLHNFSNNGQVFDIEENTIGNSFIFTPDKCFEYLRLSSLPNPGNSDGDVLIKTIKITEIKALDIIGPNTLTTNQEANYSIEYNGFPINSNFSWSVTGDLQITGSASGPTVNIKANSLNGGTITATLDGCQILRKEIASIDIGTTTIVGPSGIIYGGFSTYYYTAYNKTQGKTYTWKVGNMAQIVNGQGTSTIGVMFQQFSENSFPFQIPISVIVTGEYNTAPEVTYIQTVHGCNSCPAN